MLTPSVHRIMPHVPQKFYRIGNQQKLGLFPWIFSFFIRLFQSIGLLLKLVQYDLSKKHPCLIFCNQTKTVQFLQHFFHDQRIEILTMHSQMSDAVNISTVFEYIMNLILLETCT